MRFTSIFMSLLCANLALGLVIPRAEDDDIIIRTPKDLVNLELDEKIDARVAEDIIIRNPEARVVPPTDA